MQLATTMGFVLGKRKGDFMGLTPAETNAVHVGRWLKTLCCLQFTGSASSPVFCVPTFHSRR